MCGQTRPRAAAAFVGMWLAMMAAMMMPSLVPTLWRFRQYVAAVCPARAGRLTLLAGVGYFLVWSFVGVFVYACGAALAVAALQSAAFARRLPLAAGIVVACAGIMQFSAWKAHHLAAYRDACRCSAASIADARAALEQGMRAGVHCACSSAGLTVAGIAFGMMDWRTMVCLTALLTAERIAPHGTRIAQAAGVLGIAAGLWAIASSLFNI
jgi:predicted metal-binding membrane protein